MPLKILSKGRLSRFPELHERPNVTADAIAHDMAVVRAIRVAVAFDVFPDHGSDDSLVAQLRYAARQLVLR